MRKWLREEGMIETAQGYALGFIHCDSKNDSGNHQILHHLCECCSQALFLLQSEKRSDEIDCKVLPKV